MDGPTLQNVDGCPAEDQMSMFKLPMTDFCGSNDSLKLSVGPQFTAQPRGWTIPVLVHFLT